MFSNIYMKIKTKEEIIMSGMITKDQLRTDLELEISNQGSLNLIDNGGNFINTNNWQLNKDSGSICSMKLNSVQGIPSINVVFTKLGGWGYMIYNDSLYNKNFKFIPGFNYSIKVRLYVTKPGIVSFMIEDTDSTSVVYGSQVTLTKGWYEFEDTFTPSITGYQNMFVIICDQNNVEIDITDVKLCQGSGVSEDWTPSLKDMKQLCYSGGTNLFQDAGFNLGLDNGMWGDYNCTCQALACPSAYSGMSVEFTKTSEDYGGIFQNPFSGIETNSVNCWNVGDVYTISGYFKLNSKTTGSLTANVMFGLERNQDSLMISNISCYANAWTPFNYTFTVMSDSSDNSIIFYFKNKVTVQMKDLMLTKGGQTSSWNVASRDIVNEINKVSNIQNAQSASQSMIMNNVMKLGTLEQEVATLQKNASSEVSSTAITDINNRINSMQALTANAPSSHDCNDFTVANQAFTWDTGNGAFNNTPLGNLKANSAIVFVVENIGEQGRIQQIFRQLYPPTNEYVWIRNWAADSGTTGIWGPWNQIMSRDSVLALNNFTAESLQMPTPGAWVSDSIKNLPLIGGANYTYKENTNANLVFGVAGMNQSLNMVIDGDYYGKNGQIPVVQSIQNNTNALTALQTMVANNQETLAGQLYSKTMTCPNDANKALTFGVYNVAGNVANLPANSDNYGILVVYTAYTKTVDFGPTYGWIWQLYYTTDNNVWFRSKCNTGAWSEWGTLGISTQSQLSILNPKYNGNLQLPVDESWANSSINKLPIIGGAKVAGGVTSPSNIIYLGAGKNFVNMVIDGDFYALNGQVPVGNSINSIKNQVSNIQNAQSASEKMITNVSSTVNSMQATESNAPSSHDCNDFTKANSSFLWDTGEGAFNNTPIGNLADNSSCVFTVTNYGGNFSYGSRILQIFRFVLSSIEQYTSCMWVRTLNEGGTWNPWEQIITDVQLDEIQNTIDSIGGANLFLDTFIEPGNPVSWNANNLSIANDTEYQSMYPIYSNAVLAFNSNSPYGKCTGRFFKTNNQTIMSGWEYTVSFYYASLHLGEALTNLCNIVCVLGNGKGGDGKEVKMPITGINFNSCGSNWVKASMTFTAPANIRRIELELGFECNNYAWACFDGIKLEQGAVATGYRPSFYDSQTQLSQLPQASKYVYNGKTYEHMINITDTATISGVSNYISSSNKSCLVNAIMESPTEYSANSIGAELYNGITQNNSNVQASVLSMRVTSVDKQGGTNSEFEPLYINVQPNGASLDMVTSGNSSHIQMTAMLLNSFESFENYSSIILEYTIQIYF